MWNFKTFLVLLGITIMCSYTATTGLRAVEVTYDTEEDVIYFNGRVFVDEQLAKKAAKEENFRFLAEEHTATEGEAHATEGEHAEGGEEEERRYSPGTYMFYYCLAVAVCLTMGAGVMSGLTVGYLSIDQLELEMKLQNGTDEEKKHALAVLPVLEDHHYLLVTLLLANALCMEALPIYLDSIVPSAYAILISVIAVLFFGEVIPQAICTGPQQIRIGACLAPLIQLLKIVLGVVAYPIAKILDCALGEHMSTRYSNNDLKALIELHTFHAVAAIDNAHSHHAPSGGLQEYQTRMIKSVIDFRKATVSKLMIPANRIFSLNVHKNINNNTAKKITKAGFSRIPVYEKGDKNRIIGILLIKTLIGLDLTTGRKISDLVNEGEVTLRKPIFISSNEKLEVLVKEFSKGKSHMAIVTDDPEKMEDYLNGLEEVAGEVSMLDGDFLDPDKSSRLQKEPAKVLGIITLEDLIENIMEEDILDEADYDNDLLKNKDPNMRSYRLGNNNSGLPLMYTENKDKIQEYVQENIKENLGDKSKLKIRKDYTKSISARRGTLQTPLIELEKIQAMEKSEGNKSSIHDAEPCSEGKV